MQLKIRYHFAVNDFWMVVFTAQTCPVKLQQWQSDCEAKNWDTEEDQSSLLQWGVR